MFYSRDEQVWIERKARGIARERGWHWPLPIARLEAQTELVRIQRRPKAEVIPLHQWNLSKSAEQGSGDETIDESAEP